MKKVIRKRMSIEDLALSMNRGFKSVNKKIAGVDNKVDSVIDLVDKLAISTAKGFEDIEARLNSKIDTKVGELKSQIQGIDNRLDDIAMDRVKYEDHDKLKTRVDFIEKKLEIKK